MSLTYMQKHHYYKAFNRNVYQIPIVGYTYACTKYVTNKSVSQYKLECPQTVLALLFINHKTTAAFDMKGILAKPIVICVVKSYVVTYVFL